ncbi:serine--tRNA ligase [Sulfobacillus harzensis]|uniref:Serine--tRNA ligase n=1 Tax=Sulfobacillus harzensis TaxID=2729629 RepID=A0A7Y0L1A6_9FIRM|nr:serine--tRNA ligase [Sulfobacillus harzensis]NMP20906.1 serine--tRNA ligase [Sulfobacillus harzensis]
MLDIRRIRQEPDVIQRLLAKKGVEVDLGELLTMDERRRTLLGEMESLKAERNRSSEEVARRKKAGEPAEELILAMRNVGERIQRFEADVRALDLEIGNILLTIPNTPLPEVPDGKSADDNVKVRNWGTVPTFDFEPKPHWELGEALHVLDFERGRKLSGARFTVFSGRGAQLSRALINFMLDHNRRRGYVEMATPYLVNRDALVGTGQFPKFEEDVFRVVPHEYYLIPTAEVTLTNLHRDEILDDKDLPIRYTGYTASFRAEAGAAGRDTRGIIRQHQFDKVELVRFVRPDESDVALNQMVADAEDVLQQLGLPYRTVLLCGGDMGFSQAMTYDIEVWMPSYGRYVEISSCSNMGDFQARRANIRYRPEGSKKTEFVHTLNGSALAIGRTFAAILENFQQEDGSVRLPDVLQPYFDGPSVLKI